jgi:hypothetical protein
MKPLQVVGLLLVALLGEHAKASHTIYCHSSTKKYEVTITLGATAHDSPSAEVVIDHAPPALSALSCEKTAGGRIMVCASSSGSSQQGYEARFSDFGGPLQGAVWKRQPQGKTRLTNLFCSSST